LTEDQLRDKVLAYCARYKVSPGPDGLPPFPSGKRESVQHREWLTVYKALQRARLRSAGAPSLPAGPATDPRLCPLCARPVEREPAVLGPRRAGSPARLASLHPTCAELVRLAETAGPDAVSRLAGFLWPARARTESPTRLPPSRRPPRG
jgi:hypothetical protein